jgi:glutamate/tyrosine decarboxylase-like PLP-dependent enzyme
MRKQLLELEKTSRLLEPSPGERKAARDKVVAYTEAFIRNIETSKAFSASPEKGAGLLASPISEKGIGIEEALGILQKNVDQPGLNPASGGHLGYIPGGGIYYSALGDYMADITNRYAGIFFAGPGAVRMENMLLRWIAEVCGYPKKATGNLTSGGSLANLVGIVTARDARKITSRNMRRSVIYLSSQAHHSVEKAIRIAGLNECVTRHVKLDEQQRIDAEALDALIKKDRAKKLNPFLVIASAGTTDTGAIDPLDAIADLAEKYGLWYHIDAAYGGFFVLTAEGKKKLKGMERSDSLVVDPHKGLFLPYGLGAVLVKDRKALQTSHHYQANYMQDALKDEEEISPADVSPELTKHFRGLRLWLPLKLHGVHPFRVCLEEKLLLAKYFHAEVKKLGFETGPTPELSVVTYRYRPKKGNADAFNKRLVEEVQRDGRVFISSTLVNGKFTLRLACLSFRTHLKTVDTLLNILEEKVKFLERKRSFTP